MLVLALDTATTRITAGLVELPDDAGEPRTLARVDREGARATMAALHAALADVTIEIVHCFAHDDVVATNKVIRGRHVDDWFGQAPTGDRVQLRVMDFLRFEDGRIIEHWSTVRPLERTGG